MSELPDEIEKLVNQPIVEMVGKHSLSKAPSRDYTRLKEVVQFMLTEYDRLKTERLETPQAATENEERPAKMRKRLVWPQKKS